jgi:hypothetical protein
MNSNIFSDFRATSHQNGYEFVLLGRIKIAMANP